jgi:hypothetical protein
VKHAEAIPNIKIPNLKPIQLAKNHTLAYGETYDSTQCASLNAIFGGDIRPMERASMGG